MRQDYLAAFGALGLDHGGESREAASAAAVGRHLVAHLIDIIDQDEGDACGFGGGCGDKEDRERGGSEQAAGEGHMVSDLLWAWHYGSKVCPECLVGDCLINDCLINSPASLSCKPLLQTSPANRMPVWGSGARRR